MLDEAAVNTTPPPRAKVLLINPTYKLYAPSWPPVGLAFLASALRKAGHEV